MLKNQIKDLITQGNLEDKIVIIIDRLMAYRHQQFSEIMNMPMPLVEKIMKEIDKQIERENKLLRNNGC